MAIMDIIRHRRSIRLFLDKPVEREKILRCLEAARLAPSAVNLQPWKFIVVDDKKTGEKLFQASFRGIYFFNQWASKVPVFVVVVIDKHGLISNLIGIMRDTLRALLDIGIATEHFILQAEEVGLGTCWMGGFDEKGVKRILDIPGNKKVAAIIALGYPDSTEIIKEQERRKLEEISAFNSWEGH
jgi:nitroreductase